MSSRHAYSKLSSQWDFIGGLLKIWHLFLPSAGFKCCVEYWTVWKVCMLNTFAHACFKPINKIRNKYFHKLVLLKENWGMFHFAFSAIRTFFHLHCFPFYSLFLSSLGIQSWNSVAGNLSSMYSCNKAWLVGVIVCPWNDVDAISFTAGCECWTCEWGGKKDGSVRL